MDDNGKIINDQLANQKVAASKAYQAETSYRLGDYDAEAGIGVGPIDHADEGTWQIATYRNGKITRLKATYDDHAFPYESPNELIADLELMADSLRANKGRNAGLFAVRRLLRRVRTFGFYLATVDIRQNALVHRRVIGEALQEPNWLAADDEQRARRLEEALERRESPLGALAAAARRTLAVFQTIAHGRRK